MKNKNSQEKIEIQSGRITTTGVIKHVKNSNGKTRFDTFIALKVPRLKDWCRGQLVIESTILERMT